MNVAEVKDLGHRLQAISKQITDTVNALNTKVNNTSWVGPDATKFKNDWWPQHRQHLQKMVHDLEEFGRTATKNANDQENVSRG
jgi:uncharacterized protein YukE